MARVMWGLSLSLGRPLKQQVPGSFSAWEWRRHSGKWKVPEQSSYCPGQGHEGRCPRRPRALRWLVRLPEAAWLTTAGQGAQGSGPHALYWEQLRSVSVRAAHPCPAPFAHHPASFWKSASVP